MGTFYLSNVGFDVSVDKTQQKLRRLLWTNCSCYMLLTIMWKYKNSSRALKWGGGVVAICQANILISQSWKLQILWHYLQILDGQVLRFADVDGQTRVTRHLNVSLHSWCWRTTSFDINGTSSKHLTSTYENIGQSNKWKTCGYCYYPFKKIAVLELIGSLSWNKILLKRC